MPNSFKVHPPYSSTNGLSIQINAALIPLTVADICYLLINVDGHATVAVQPPATVGFMLYGVHYQFTNGEWAVFVDALASVAGAGGWSQTACKY